MLTTRWLVILILSFDMLAIIIAIVISVYTGNPVTHQFREGRLITILSTLQLLAISGLSYKILQIRRVVRRRSFWRSPYAVWGIIALGFLFLAADELTKIHETVGNLIPAILDLEETGLTTRIDDMLVALYALASIGVLIVYRDELQRRRESLPFLIWGFVLLFVMVALDVLTHKRDILPALFDHERVTPILYAWLYVAEDSVKLISEALFFLGFYTAFQAIKHKATEPV